MQNNWPFDREVNEFYQLVPVNGWYWRFYRGNMRPARPHIDPVTRRGVQANVPRMPGNDYGPMVGQPMPIANQNPHPNYLLVTPNPQLNGGSTIYSQSQDPWGRPITNISTERAGDGHRHERLDPAYQVQADPRRFFCVGRVFQVLWSQPAEPGEKTDITFTLNHFGENVFSKVTRFVIVRANHDSCTAIQINTYKGRGLAKPGIRKSDHGIIYTGEAVPRLTAEESPPRSRDQVRVDPIRVVPKSLSDRLDSMSRINFRKVFNVEHNVKVKEYGMVCPEHLQERLVRQFNEIFSS